MIIHKLRWYRGFFSSLDYEFFLLGSDKVIKRIIFDLDRTLIPWLDEWDAMVEKTYNYFNIPFEEDLSSASFSILILISINLLHLKH